MSRAGLATKLEPSYSYIDLIKDRLRQHLRGKEEVLELSLAAFLARGHLLLEGSPGTGKTSLAKAMASAFGGSFRRVQMTSDLLPSDIVGILRLKAGGTEFEFRKGPIFSNFLLADELNRTSAKTQSALLEAMAEGTVTVDGSTYSLPDPFFVVATQNPLEFHGVYPLAESQLDRFMLQLNLDCPDKSDELKIYKGPAQDSRHFGLEEAEESPVLSLDQTRNLFREVNQVHIEESVYEFATDLVRASRTAPGIAFGVSVRGGLQLIAAARALSFLRGRNFVSPREIIDLSIPVMAHRLCFVGGDPDKEKRSEVVKEILSRVRPPR